MAESIKNLLPQIRNSDLTEIIIVTLPEATPVYEASWLTEDLSRGGIITKRWIINSSLHSIGTTNDILKAKAESEIQWIDHVHEISLGNTVLVDWKPYEITGDAVKGLI